MDEEYIDLTAPEPEAPQETTAGAPKTPETTENQGETAEKAEETGEKAESEGEGGEKKSLPGSQKQKLRAQRLAAELEQTRRELEALRQQAQPKTQAYTSEPDINQFDTLDEYKEALKQYTARTAVEQWQYEQLERQAREANQRQQAEWAHKMEQAIDGSEEAVEAIQEFTYFAQEAERKAPAVANAIGSALKESDIGPELVIHLGKHPETIERLVGMSPYRAVAELGRIEAEILAKKEGKAKPVTTQAPKPPSPVKAVGNVPGKAQRVMEIDY